MKLGRRGLVWMTLSLLLVGLGAAALYYANDLWLSGVMTVSVFAWLTGLLAVIYSRPERRPAIVGAVLASFLYVLFALGPWFRVHVGPWLLTSQALVQVETRLLGRQPQVQQLAYTALPYPATVYSSAGSTALNISQVASGATFTLVGTTSLAYSQSFVILGHWLCAWPAAGLGAVVAGWIARRRVSLVASSGQEGRP